MVEIKPRSVKPLKLDKEDANTQNLSFVFSGKE